MYTNPIDELRFECAEVGHEIEQLEKDGNIEELSDFTLGKLVGFKICFKKMMKVIDKFNKQS